MTKCMNLIHLGLASALMIATPMAAHAGSVIIANENCKSLKFDPWPKIIRRVTVHVFDYPDACTDTNVTIGEGDVKVVQLAETHEVDGKTYNCMYYHEAKGTAGGVDDVKGSAISSVTCKEDWADVCQCTKD